jgi:hypothetical protein
MNRLLYAILAVALLGQVLLKPTPGIYLRASRSLPFLLTIR